MQVKVIPNAAKNEVAGVLGDLLKIRIQSPPVDGKANKELVKFISKRLGVSKSRIAICGGAKGRSKSLAIAGITSEKARTALK